MEYLNAFDFFTLGLVIGGLICFFLGRFARHSDNILREHRKWDEGLRIGYAAGISHGKHFPAKSKPEHPDQGAGDGGQPPAG